MPAKYEIYPLKFKLPEFNGGVITEIDAFPGMVYYTSLNDVAISSDSFSAVFSDRFNIYSSSLSPKLLRYVPSIDAFSVAFFKGVYIYNPSIKKDGVDYEVERKNINFSVTGGSSFPIRISEQESLRFYEGNFFSSDLNNIADQNGFGRTSVNDNVVVGILPLTTKNTSLVYFDDSGSSNFLNLNFQNFSPGNLGTSISSLLPGEYLGIYLKFDVTFSINSKPIDYCFFNMTYQNFGNQVDVNFPEIESIPGASSPFGLTDTVYYNQSFSLRFTTNLEEIKKIIYKNIDKLYDNYPPFFLDYRYDDDTDYSR